MDEKTALTYAITKALAYTEQGGKPSLSKLRAGRTGELKSIFQFTPGTWAKDAGDVLGDPKAQITPENEMKVVTTKVSKWIDEGYTAKQIASMWNAGPGEPNAYTGKFSTGNPSKAVNTKYGVPFDVPAYANKVANYAKEFYKTDFAPKISAQPPQPVASTQPNQGLAANSSGLIAKTAPLASSVGNGQLGSQQQMQ